MRETVRTVILLASLVGIYAYVFAVVGQQLGWWGPRQAKRLWGVDR